VFWIDEPHLNGSTIVIAAVPGATVDFVSSAESLGSNYKQALLVVGSNHVRADSLHGTEPEPACGSCSYLPTAILDDHGSVAAEPTRADRREHNVAEAVAGTIHTHGDRRWMQTQPCPSSREQ